MRRQDSNLRPPGYEHRNPVLKRRSKTTQTSCPSSSLPTIRRRSCPDKSSQVWRQIQPPPGFSPTPRGIPLGLQAQRGKLVAPTSDTRISKASNTHRKSQLPVEKTSFLKNQKNALFWGWPFLLSGMGEPWALLWPSFFEIIFSDSGDQN